MPVYLFSYHGHGTWMPDREQGYVHRQYGLQPADENMADHYQKNMKGEPVLFGPNHQQCIVDAVRNTEKYITVTIHGVATEPTHAHVLVSWDHDRSWKSLRASIRRGVTEALNETFDKREWFSDQPSRKRIRDAKHFKHHITAYLPKHGGVVWIRERDRRRFE